jgi:hypothetical protein
MSLHVIVEIWIGVGFRTTRRRTTLRSGKRIGSRCGFLSSIARTSYRLNGIPG